ELVVAGKAMLATLVAPTAEPRPPPPNDAPEIEEPRRAPVPAPKGAALQPVAVPAVPDADRQPEATGPRLLVDGVGAVRYHGAIDALTAGGAARMSVPLGFVMPALWVRYTALIDHGGPGELEFTDLDIGASLGFAVLDEPVRLTVGLHGSLAIVDIESEDEREEEREVDLVALDGRL